ncbi:MULTISPECIES: SsrA-binding protein SmpB [Breznakia]|uniref:SsrA-binding protein n=1 Tax=Breznakia blatticola TaxID=1754012 RepID=A0A4R7ZFI7_9FIRM|nr:MULTISPECIES: SsrA-binding protein SmpB [Breznakia]MDH6367818.1 SsrA-binding protein [Breznakia sp. PH1-1]MDH6404885.1 SsrA-binding protein [Breznakia sp. PF1-11]MDH6412621.1 SsrA-binding protein [Breznakia sp. PFB1-11]MDH6414960.1 SsrA-binding protein [Breznakia sp. PFB1-14]MDH6417271.1 SsrA-binding protein [Breznakia sp. PFB1-4]
MQVITVNRKAKHEYFIEDTFEAGLVLHGTEIKSIRKGSVQLKESFITFIDGEAYIKNMHIPPYEYGNRFNHDETRERKLLLHKHEIKKLQQKVKLQGYTVVPLRLYIHHGKAKLEIALAKGKHLYDKRQTEKDRDASRMMQKLAKKYR